MTRKTIHIYLLCLLSLGGCMMLPPSDEAVAIYALHEAALPEEDFSGGQLHGILSIPAPKIPAGLESERIALYINNGRRLDYYASARWADDLDNVLQEVMIQTGRHALPGMIVDRSGLNIPIDYRLAVRVNEFEPVYETGPEGVPQLRVSLTFTLIRFPEESILTSFTVENAKPAPSNHLSLIVSGLESLLQEALARAYRDISIELKKEMENGTL